MNYLKIKADNDRIFAEGGFEMRSEYFENVPITEIHGRQGTIFPKIFFPLQLPNVFCKIRDGKFSPLILQMPTSPAVLTPWEEMHRRKLSAAVRCFTTP